MKEIFLYILSDYQRYTGYRSSFIKIILVALFTRYHCFTYSFWFRLASHKNIFYPLARIMYFRLSRKYGIQIPVTTKIGYGLSVKLKVSDWVLFLGYKNTEQQRMESRLLHLI